MTDPLTQTDLFKCDIRGCAGVREYCYVNTVADRPAAILVCALHRFEQWTFVHRTPTTKRVADTDFDGDSQGPRPRATISRADWLRLEIAAAEQYVSRFADSNDPIARAQVHRRQRELIGFRAELAILEPPTAR